MDELPPDAAGARDPFSPDFVPATPRAAATLILLRRGGRHADRGLEVLMVKRNPNARFMPGVWVFPGGSLEADELILGVKGSDVDTEADELAHRAAAIRELREEAGIELADDAELLLWSRWITPEPVPVRFDTRFYVALAPAHSRPRADGGEVVDAEWMGPAEALERRDAGDIELAFPTVKHIESLLPFASAEEVMEAARERVVEPVMPMIVPADEPPGWRMLLPGDEGYVPPRV